MIRDHFYRYYGKLHEHSGGAIRKEARGHGFDR